LRQDRRRQGAFLTPRGKRQLATLTRGMVEHERKFVSLFTARERRLLLPSLQRIIAAR
jgi:DNA-binding MarR family transcriptional regulator